MSIYTHIHQYNVKVTIFLELIEIIDQVSHCQVQVIVNVPLLRPIDNLFPDKPVRSLCQ